MLALSRQKGESVKLFFMDEHGKKQEIVIKTTRGTRLLFDAPQSVKILRENLEVRR